MVKTFVCIALLCVALVSVNARPGQGDSGHGGPGGPGGHGGQGWQGWQGGHGGEGGHSGESGEGGSGRLATKLCANATLAQSFVTQLQQLFSTLQSNGSFTQVLANRAQEIAYLGNTTNTALLSSNCTAFFSGLDSAKAADQAANQAAQQVQQQYQQIARGLFFQIIQSLFGGHGY